MSSRSSSPPNKRVKVESVSPKHKATVEQLNEDILLPDDFSEDHCTICLQEVVDRTMIPICSHDLFCFDCLMIWTEQSRRCPLCSQDIGDHIIHNYRSRYDYQKHFLPPLRTTSPKSLAPMGSRPRPGVSGRFDRRRRIPREIRERSRREREERDEANRFERALAKRKWIYRHNLYAKHVASNSYTRFRPFPTPAQFAASPDLISRTTSFLRRELLVWMDLDVEFLTTFIISLMKAIDIRSESAVKLLAEFLDMDAPYIEGGRHVNAEHFAHEVYSYVRSPFKDLFVYDTVVQYDTPPDVSSPRRYQDTHRQRSRLPLLHERRDRRGRSRSRSTSWSPSGRERPSCASREKSREREVDEDSFATSLVRRSPSLEPVLPSRPIVSAGERSVTPSQNMQHVEHDEPVGPSSNGKEKAVAGSMLPDSTSAVEQSLFPSTSFTLDRPSRFRNLQASVQAHLGSDRARNIIPLQIKGQASLSPSSSKALISPSLKIKGQGKPSLSSQSYPPSLLSRISDTFSGENINPVTAVLSSSSLSNDSQHLHPRDGDGGLLTRYDVSEQPRTYPLSPENMSSVNAPSGFQDTHSQARDNRSMTHNTKQSVSVVEDSDTNERTSANAFLAKGIRSASNDSEGPNDNPHVDPGLTYQRRMNSGVLGSVPRPSSVPIQESHTPASNLNMRLFQKLEEEKRHLQDNNLSATMSTSEGSGDIVVGRNSAAVTDPQAAEAKLRARAQLKKRLANEKRNLALPS